ncbi:hypothetical protein JZ751_004271 [Albula glossodonta]|uniref:Uncharacterized protein n=1 Tax=Albula glossodonta TaxID=121402 RepID=A0A8T2N5S6_9TELE|nr:hypothetical protein JZ751_004271 [Albula glossodonta]
MFANTDTRHNKKGGAHLLYPKMKTKPRTECRCSLAGLPPPDAASILQLGQKPLLPPTDAFENTPSVFSPPSSCTQHIQELSLLLLAPLFTRCLTFGVAMAPFADQPLNPRKSTAALSLSDSAEPWRIVSLHTRAPVSREQQRAVGGMVSWLWALVLPLTAYAQSGGGDGALRKACDDGDIEEI